MKKPVLMVLALAAGVAGWAQRPVGDTLRILDTTYYCHPRDLSFNEGRCTVTVSWWYCAGLTEHDYSQPYGSYSREDLTGGAGGTVSGDGYGLFSGNGIVGRQMETDRPLKVVGIAAAVWCQPGRVIPGSMAYPGLGPNHDYYTVLDTSLATRAADSMALYKMTPDGLTELASAGWRMDSPHRIMEFFRGALSDNPHVTLLVNRPDYTFTQNTKVSLYEAMFENPVIVEDSFVVAGIAMNNEGHYVEFPLDKTHSYWAFDHNPTRYLRYYYAIEDYENEVFYNNRYLWEWGKFRNLPWRKTWCAISEFKRQPPDGYTMTDEWWKDTSLLRHAYACPLVFPIIETGFDTALCHDVSGLRVAELGAGQATLMWDSGDGGPWEVAIGKVTDPWESYTITTTTVPMATVTGLQRGVQYFALVRGYCSLTEEYGQWSEPVEVEVFQDPEPEGIGREAVEDGMTYMVPNPTSGVTNVMSSYRMQRIAVYDTKGTKVHEQEVDGIAAEVDASAWPKGVYIVAMYLDHGVKTRRLVVQ